MLRVDELRVNYGRVPAVQAVSLRVAAGEVVALVGPNGAGKSTTLSAIFGLVTPVAGTIVFEGESLVGLHPEAIARRGLALVPEGRHIFSTLTVAENLTLGTIGRRERRVAVDLEKTLGRFPALKHSLKAMAGNLSGGEQQQLALARAFLSRPRLLLVDEPSLGLAPMVVDLVFDTLEDLRRDGVTMLLVEQNAARACQFADRFYILRSGRIAHSGIGADRLAMKDFEAAYLGI